MKISTFFFAAFILAGLLLAASNSSAQAPTYLWAKSVGGTDYDDATSVTADVSGNIIVVGWFRSKIITFGSTTLTHSGGDGYDDMFIVKYDALGNVVWAKSADGADNDDASSVTTDASGNIIVVGSFQSKTITFGSITLTNANDSDIFIVKFDANGKVIWAKSAGGTISDFATSVTTDISGNIIVAGGFSSKTLTFGSYTLTNSVAQGINMFIVKFSPAGSVIWAKSAGGTFDDMASSVSSDKSGNIIVIGTFGSTSITFGAVTLENAGSSNTTSTDLFIVKYDTAGNVLWVKSVGGTDSDIATSVTTDAKGNCIVVGYFWDNTLTFGSTTLTNANNVIYSKTKDMFIAKYDSTGKVIWAKSAGGKSDDYASSVTSDASGNIIVTGWFGSSFIFFESNTLTIDSGSVDMFIVKYDDKGNVLWAKSSDGSKNDHATSVTTDISGNIYAVGSYQSSTLTLGSITLVNSKPNDKYYSILNTPDIFITKVSGTTGIDQITADNSLSFAPNPFNSEIQIKGTEETGEITVLDVMGNEVIRRQLNSSETRINTEDLPTGVYMLKYVSEKRIVRSKLVKF